jgi:outer membrane lipase/esterase
MKISNLLRLIIVLLTAVMVAPVNAGSDISHDKSEHHSDDLAGLVIFGDSLSDTGNKYIETGLLNRPPYDLLDEFLVPDGPYARGGKNHSNGALWIEQLARPMGLGRDVRPSLSNNEKGNNYAYGGARARAALTSPNRHLPMQINDFMADVNSSPSADPLYVLFIGGNDVADAVRALANDPTGATSVGIIIEALTSISSAIQDLYNYSQGARDYVVFNSPDLGLTPAFNPPLNVADAPIFGTCFTLLFNLGGDATLYPSPHNLICSVFGFPPEIPGIKDIVSELEAGLPGTTFTRIDSFALFRDIVNNPRDYRLENVTDPCVMPNEPPYVCKKPNKYLFWDGIHPTKEVHGIIADHVEDVIDD